MLNVVCLKTGDKYNADYVKRLASMVDRHLKREFNFVCITDSPFPYVLIDFIKAEEGLPGWWGKIKTFKQGLFNHGDYVLFLDLDIVITGGLDELVDYGIKEMDKERPLVIIEDFNRPGGYGSAVMFFRVNRLPYVYDDFMVERDGIMARYHGDQEYLEKAVPCASFWPREWVLSYKVDGLADSIPPQDSKIVCFHGPPKNHEVNDEWMREAWA